MANRRPSACDLACIVACLLLAFWGSEVAGATRYAVSKSPYWAVGNRSDELSRACQRGRFNQIEHHRVYIAFDGERGRGIVGIARKGINLSDPTNLAQPDVYYHFHNDGYADCAVYVAG